VFNAIFNNISVMSWRSVLLVEETGVPEENQWTSASHCQTLSRKVVSTTHRRSRIINIYYFFSKVYTRQAII